MSDLARNRWDLILEEHEAIKNLREYLKVMALEPEGYIKLSEVYHSIRRMIGDE